MSDLLEKLSKRFSSSLQEITLSNNEVTVEILANDIKKVCLALRDEEAFLFEQCIDICGVDYLHYGCSEWTTEQASLTGFERGVLPISESNPQSNWKKPRFSVVYHLLSIEHNQRLRVKAFVQNEEPIIDSVVDIWRSANWFEREAYDLYGILFAGHPDLRRILTDYGFIGHPFRKDFPLVGELEVRYDAKAQRVIYEPVDIEPRVLVPKVIRKKSETNI